MIKFKITSWDNCPINVYYRIVELLESDMPNYEKQVGLISILCDVDEDQIWALSLAEVSNYVKGTEWVFTFDFDRERKFKKINIGDVKCNVVPDLFNFSVAQYVDFQTYWKARKNKLAEMVSVFVIPEGKSYNQGYDMLEFQRLIGDNLPLTVAQSLCFFFLKNLALSIKALQIYLDYQVKKMKKNIEDPQRKLKVEEMRNKMSQLMQDLFGCLL